MLRLIKTPAAVMMALGLFVVLFFSLLNMPGLAIDYGPLHYSGQLFSDGEPLYDSQQIAALIEADGGDPATSRFLYPPAATLLLYPLTTIPIQHASLLFQMLNALASVAALWLLIKMMPLQYQFRGALLMAVLTLISLPFWVSTLMGQINGLVLLGLSLFVWGIVRNKKGVASVALGVIIILKVFPIIFLGFCVAQRQWRVLAYSIVTVVVIVLGSLLMLNDGIGLYQTYFSEVLPDVLNNAEILSDRGVSSLTAISTTIFSQTWSSTLSLMIPLLGYGVWFFSIWRRPAPTKSFMFLVDFSITIMLVFLLSRYVIYHYFIWALVPLFTLMWYWIRSRHQWVWWVMGGGSVLLAIHLMLTTILRSVSNDTIALLLYPTFWFSMMVIFALFAIRKIHILDRTRKAR